MKIAIVAGARPNFMKVAPMLKNMVARQNEFKKIYGHFEYCFIHTGQHYDYEMSQAFFEDLEIPQPDIHLKVGSGTHSEQTARIMIEFEKSCSKIQPDIVIVVGDVNSTMACSIVAKKMGIKLMHIEAGLRSHDMSMPEEINRLVTDALSDYLMVTDRYAIDNLQKEGKSSDKIHFVGNIMIDSLIYGLAQLKEYVAKRPASTGDDYGLITLHRPSNVDNKDQLEQIIRALMNIQRKICLIFPMHPRTRNNIKKMGINKLFEKGGSIHISTPTSYIKFIDLMKKAKFVITDSGGIQEETTYLGIPCLTLRENTERPITIIEGTNKLTNLDEIESDIDCVLCGNWKKGKIPEKWDGHTASRIVDILYNIPKCH